MFSLAGFGEVNGVHYAEFVSSFMPSLSNSTRHCLIAGDACSMWCTFKWISLMKISTHQQCLIFFMLLSSQLLIGQLIKLNFINILAKSLEKQYLFIKWCIFAFITWFFLQRSLSESPWLLRTIKSSEGKTSTKQSINAYADTMQSFDADTATKQLSVDNATSKQ